MTEDRPPTETTNSDRIDSFPSHGNRLVIYDREVIDAWLISDHFVDLEDRIDAH